MTRGRTLVLSVSLAALLGSWAAPSLRADPIHYVSWGEVGLTPSSPSNAPDPTISFQGVTQGTFDGTSSFSLGQFDVAPLAAGASKAYTNVPFAIAVQFDGPNGEDSATITGRINGNTTGASTSNLAATIDQIAPSFNIDLVDGVTPPIPSFTGKYFPLSALQVDGPFQFVSTKVPEQTPVLGNVTVAPEPSLGLMFLIAVCGWTIRKYGSLTLNRA